MTRCSVFSEEENKWMEKYLSEWGTTKSKINFMLKISPLFFKDFPIDPTPEEIASCGGDVAQARVHEDVVQRYKERKAQIKTWFANHSRERGTGPDIPGIKRPVRSRVLSLETKPRKPQEYQAWQRLYYHNEDVQAEYKAAWAQAMKEGWTSDQQVKFQSQFAQQHLDAADPETLQAVQDYCKEGYLQRDDLVLPVGVQDTEDMRRAAIDNLPHTISAAAESWHRQTGLQISIMVGGPFPRSETAEIQTMYYGAGKNLLGCEFVDVNSDFKTDWRDVFHAFCEGSYTSQERMRRRVVVAADNSAKPGSAPTASSSTVLPQADENTPPIGCAPPAAVAMRPHDTALKPVNKPVDDAIDPQLLGLISFSDNAHIEAPASVPIQQHLQAALPQTPHSQPATTSPPPVTILTAPIPASPEVASGSGDVGLSGAAIGTPVFQDPATPSPTTPSSQPAITSPPPVTVLTAPLPIAPEVASGSGDVGLSGAAIGTPVVQDPATPSPTTPSSQPAITSPPPVTVLTAPLPTAPEVASDSGDVGLAGDANGTPVVQDPATLSPTAPSSQPANASSSSVTALSEPRPAAPEVIAGSVGIGLAGAAVGTSTLHDPATPSSTTSPSQPASALSSSVPAPAAAEIAASGPTVDSQGDAVRPSVSEDDSDHPVLSVTYSDLDEEENALPSAKKIQTRASSRPKKLKITGAEGFTLDFSQPTGDLVKNISLSKDLPEYFTAAVAFFAEAVTEPAFVNMLRAYILFEAKARFLSRNSVTKSLMRPSMTTKWINNTKRTTYMVTCNEPQKDFFSWNAWWISLQPSWRCRPSAPLSRAVPRGQSTTFPEIKNGKNGVVVVVLTLVWIFLGAMARNEGGVNVKVLEAVEDVTWVLTLATKTPATADINEPRRTQKRSAKTAAINDENDVPAKRTRKSKTA
ncbi:hypothetical protein PUNSTDRAFT_137734 [Punctularia strigosozonata HHB-11173 SS5]|uniref:uncharacterized protein n=1 Tax=Punctularia strigosozonata (strain HHB-11173) TaxID=741275 RepID=UPI0004417595|nr:uncharacterized protein PUNSTDRAFT_137734 [Punctularia strigosozonata HHB-11173 SS5]EIN05635.1 hypothetical protein PUNSTDRAFT_137734 [Punctularia strigosozonata HHB-11173 SS5]